MRLLRAMRRKVWQVIQRDSLIIVCCLVLLVGSALAESGKPQEGSKEKTLIIGLIPEQNIFNQLERYTPLTDYIFQKTGITIKLKVLTRYGNIIDNFVSQNMDGAFFGSFTYALANKKIGVDVLARPEALDGTSTYYGLIFTRKDSGINTVADMKGKRFAFVDKATTAGYLLPLAYFKQHGIKNYKTYLKETYFTGTHEDAIVDVMKRDADIGAAKNTVFERLARRNANIGKVMKTLATSPEVPENGLALKHTLPAAVRHSVLNTLLQMHLDPAGQIVLKKFGARRFIPTSSSDYEPVFRYARSIGIDLTTYDYMND